MHHVTSSSHSVPGSIYIYICVSDTGGTLFCESVTSEDEESNLIESFNEGKREGEGKKGIKERQRCVNNEDTKVICHFTLPAYM